MTNKQPDPLSIADELDCHNARLDRQAAKAIRTQHADLLRKDALLRKALWAMESDAWGAKEELVLRAITKELQ